jgi:hypothetical protein
MHPRKLAPGLFALLAGCAAASYQGNENSPFYVVPAGARATLNQELAIPPENVAVFIQDGRVMPEAEINRYYAHCKFELYTRRAESRTVAPDEFTVIRAFQEESQSVQAEPLRYASLRLAVIGDGDVSGPSMMAFATRLFLRSAKQPDVYRLSCATWGFPSETQHVTFAQIRRTLGGLITLRVP